MPRSQETENAVIGENIKTITGDISDIKVLIKQIQLDARDNYATKSDLYLVKENLDQVRKIIFYIIGMVLAAVVTAGLRFIIVQK